MATADEWISLFALEDYFEIENRFVRGSGLAATSQ